MQYIARMHNTFIPLNKSQIPTVLLQEYGRSWFLPNCTTVCSHDQSWVRMTEWRMLYASLYSAHLYGSHSVPELSAVNTTIAGYEGQTAPIPIPVLHVDYSNLRPYAVIQNLLRVQNNQLRPLRQASI